MTNNRNISIHAPARGATGWMRGLKEVGRDISIHAPARGATNPQRANHEGGRGISIHAPARGATEAYYFNMGSEWISIHAPARGATMILRKYLYKRKNFNPRTREGCDQNCTKKSKTVQLFQSTHPRGVRRFKGLIL